MAKKFISEAVIAAEIRANEKDWFVAGKSLADVKACLKSNHGLSIRRFVVEVKVDPVTKKEKKKYSDDFTETIRTIGKYYGRLKKKSMSEARTLASEDWDKLKHAVESLWPEIVGLTMPQGYELIRTRVRTNKQQLMGLPKRLQFWEVSIPK